MELKDLSKFILIIVLSAMLLGVGILSIYNLGEAVKTSENVINETIAIVSGTGTTTHDEVSAITGFTNQTGSLAADLTNNVTSLNWTVGTGVVYVDGNFPDDPAYLINYTYDADSKGSDAMVSSLSAVSPIATTWIPLIVTIGSLAIVLFLVIKSFGGQKR